MPKAKKYDSTVARIAGNIASGLATDSDDAEFLARLCVQIARAIVAETARTEPPEQVPEGIR